MVSFVPDWGKQTTFPLSQNDPWLQIFNPPPPPSAGVWRPPNKKASISYANRTIHWPFRLFSQALVQLKSCISFPMSESSRYSSLEGDTLLFSVFSSYHTVCTLSIVLMWIFQPRVLIGTPALSCSEAILFDDHRHQYHLPSRFSLLIRGEKLYLFYIEKVQKLSS